MQTFDSTMCADRAHRPGARIMDKVFMRLAVAAGTLLLSGSLASAASPTFCAAHFAPEAGLRIQKVRALGGCGQDMNDPFWSTNQSVQIRWCTSVDEDTARTRIGEIAQIANKCDYCRVYATSVATAAAENIKYSCGFKYDGDERWRPDRAFHFDGCIKFCSVSEITSRCNGDLPSTKNGLNSIVVDVTSQVAQCKAEKNIGTASSALTLPRNVPPLQDTIQRLKHPSKPRTKSGDYLSKSSDTTSRRATFRKSSVTSGNDLANPSGGTVRRAANPCKSATATKPCAPASSLLSPGILESGGDFARQGPAGTGVAPGGSSGGAATRIPSNLR
jgi:hypothetical protein